MKNRLFRRERASDWSPGRIMIVLVAVALPLALVFSTAGAKDMVSVRISGPGIEGQQEFFDEETVALFRNLETAGFVTSPPAGLSDLVFEIQLGVGDGDQVFAYNVYLYSPRLDGSAGHLYFADVINGSSSAEGAWFPISEESDQALRRFLASHGGTVTLGELPDQSGTAPLFANNFAAWMAASLVIAAGFGAARANRAQPAKTLEPPTRT